MYHTVLFIKCAKRKVKRNKKRSIAQRREATSDNESSQFPFKMQIKASRIDGKVHDRRSPQYICGLSVL